MKQVLIAFMALMVFSLDVAAVEPDEIMKDAGLEARAREVSKDLRCVVCQNQSIDDSNSGIAKKMRILVRDRIAQGDSNQQVKDYLVSRYGDFVLLKPPVKAKTMALWFGPALMVVIGLIGIIFYYRRRSTQTAETTGAAPLSADEKARLDALLKEEGSET
ncbi:Cytochrome c-type biogenesis protein CcmH [Candidatus Terasakiella magnetica]|uniref:Cytochrome c-type biogenesis protein n=1 Tax=Candidatus Terasakiella magnetica TaxID=1867952 RepID=A0A1C3RID3_9PROT|nr:cytochrome c-type biogenesis protein [Candidatus Terasakiella magnetica]SCA57031.1 Cytochrome c-type biogenesis protein CcmH [Candidatus Terasakiella magnetica]